VALDTVRPPLYLLQLRCSNVEVHSGAACRDILGYRRVAEEATGITNVLMLLCPILFRRVFELQSVTVRGRTILSQSVTKHANKPSERMASVSLDRSFIVAHPIFPTAAFLIYLVIFFPYYLPPTHVLAQIGIVLPVYLCPSWTLNGSVLHSHSAHLVRCAVQGKTRSGRVWGMALVAS
jgi:hypothetical protein